MQNLLNYILSISNNQMYIIYIIVIIISFLLYFFTRYIILKSISKIFKKTKTEFDDILVERGVLNRLSYFIPLVFIYNLKDLIAVHEIVDRVLISLITLIIISSFNAFINVLNDIYSKSQYSNRFNIKSYIQIIKLFINMFGIIIIIALLTGKSPIYFLSGLGALTAVLMLVFKDTILSLVASIQISSNDLFKIGDWIEAPQFGADGDVIDIALHSVKIQNWDKTISIIPTHKLTDSSFKNWRGMSDSGGRRIKRSIKIDMNSIKFCDHSMIKRFEKFKVISEYINQKKIEINKHNLDNNINEEELINGRSLTNIGTYRAYIEGYLRNHKSINSKMTFLVRQLAPEANGLPIEIYVFSSDTNWVNYEDLQSNIFDHLLAVLSEFDLKVFQNPTGKDFRKL
ncbi:MAG: mechanosensitive ion channel protein MscS [Chloroflexi bacterium]|nr:mechanosensitive ion channel protein MscS [Chloroflexota bacterium]